MEPASSDARKQQLDAVVHLVEEVRPVRPFGLQAAEQRANVRDVHQLAGIVVVAVHHQRHLPPVAPGVLAGCQEDLKARYDRSQVGCFDLAARDHQDDWLGDSWAEVEEWRPAHRGDFRPVK